MTEEYHYPGEIIEPCKVCEGRKKIPVIKIPFTDLYVWYNCNHCRGTGLEHMGFLR